MQVLIVEDESKFAAFLQQAFAEAGHSADVAHDGEEGLRLALGADYDLLILDWLLPGRDGPSLCAGVRAAGKTGPILMLTARDSVDDRIAGLDAGADDYLTKPFALGELFARVRALQRRGSAAASPSLAVGGLTLDPMTRRVGRGGRDVSLSAKEYALLEYLMRHPRRTITRAEIIRNVWGFGLVGETNAVDVYINYLRNKIDRDQSPRLIRTVRKVGYFLDDGADTHE